MMYKAICVRLSNVRKHPNADRLQLATVCGEQVIVGLENKEGDFGIYFATDGQLSEEFAKANDLVQRVGEDGKRAGGFFSTKRQVRSQNFRGERSDGYWCPISALDFAGGGYPLEGVEFDTWNGIPICNKYITEATKKAAAGPGKPGRARRKNLSFPEHIDTGHLSRSIHTIANDGLCIQTQKLHGTSQRVGFVEMDVAIPQTWLDKLLRRQRYKREFRRVIGTRRTVLEDREWKGYYGCEEFRWEAVEHFIGNLNPGEIVYGEVVGYKTSGKPIMQAHNGMVYHYGCQPGTCKFYAYRITQNGVELPWFEVVRRCEVLGIETVPLENITLVVIPDDNPDDHYDFGHIREGRVLRFESPTQGYRWLKEKTHEFNVAEGLVKMQDDYVDTEEAS